MGGYKGHPNYYKGKLDLIDMVKFAEAFQLYYAHQITKGEYAKRIGVTYPTLDALEPKLINKLNQMIMSGQAVWRMPDGTIWKPEQ